MLRKKQSAVIIINDKQSNLLLKNWLRLHSGPSLKKSTPAPLLLSKIVKTPVGVHSDTPAPKHLWSVEMARAANRPDFGVAAVVERAGR